MLANLAGVWSYATTEWLRLSLPSEDDKTRSRWPVHPLWQYLSSVDWEGDGGPFLPRFTPTRAPDNNYLFGRGLSLLFAFMAREGITDFRTAGERYLSWLYSFGERRCEFEGISFPQHVQEQIAIRARRFNTALNLAPDEQPDIEAEAEAYRRASDGE